MASIELKISAKVKYLIGPFLALVTLQDAQTPFHRFLVFWGRFIVAEWDVKHAQ